MRRSITTLLLALTLGAFLTVGLSVASATVGTLPVAQAQELDTDVPPGNPVIGDDRPGDIQSVSNTNYALWGAIAVCLIGAGVLLIRIERWEARRIEHQSV